MPRLFSAWLLGLALLLALPAAAEARGGAGAIEQHLLQKGVQALTRAEKAWFAQDKPTARRFGLEAETLFEDVLKHNPRQRTAALLGGQAAVFAAEKERARRWLGRFLAMSPAGESDPDVHYLRAFVLLLSEELPAQALRSLQRMYSLNARARPRARDTLWWIGLANLGREYLRGGKTTEAARQFATGARVARRLGDRRKEILMLGDLGAAYMRGDRFIEAVEVYEGLAKLQPNSPLWLWRLGKALANQTRFKEATEVYRKVIALQESGVKLDPRQAEELDELPLRLGNCLRHLGGGEVNATKRAKLLTEAQQHLEQYVKDHPRDARAHKWLGVLFDDQLERPYVALEHYKRSFGLDPLCDDVLRRMLQIVSRYPAPEGTSAEAWKTTREAMTKDLAEGAEDRGEARKARKKKNGDDGCS